LGKNKTAGTRLTGNKSEIVEFNYTPNGRWLFTGGEGEIFAWDTTNLNLPPIRFEGPIGTINKFVFSPDLKTLFVMEYSGIVFCFDITNINGTKTHKGIDLYTIDTWPPNYEQDPTHSRRVEVNKKTLTVFENNQKFQTLNFPREITAHRLSHDANSIMVSANKATFCLRMMKNFKDKKKYGLAWDNGDELFCHKTKLCNCKGLSPMNKRVLEENGAIVVQAVETKTAPTIDGKALQKN